MKYNELKYGFGNGVFPNWTSKDTSGAGFTDGTEYHKLSIDDGWEGVSQAIMAYASEVNKYNNPAGTVGIPNGINEAIGVSQILQALQKAHGIGPGNYVLWANYDDPSITKDRVILLAGQGILRANYPALDAATYVGDANNAAVAAAGGKFYRSSDAAGLIPDIAGVYLQLPAQPRPTSLKKYSQAEGHFTVTGAFGWVTTKSFAIPYRTENNNWRLKFNIWGSCNANNRLEFSVNISGVSFFGNSQAISGYFSVGLSNYGPFTQARNTNELYMRHTNLSTNGYSWSGDIRLNQKPTWAREFEYKWGIRY